MNSVYRMADIDENLRIAGLRPLDVLVVGGTGAGKSSTLNTLFQREVAKVGNEGEPETMSVNSVRLNNLLRFWDTPGLGDNVYKDKEYAKAERNYNVEKLLDMIIDNIPKERRQIKM